MSRFRHAGGWTNFKLKIKDGPHIVPVFRHSLHGLLFPLWSPVYFLTGSSWRHGCSRGSGRTAGGRGQMARGASLGDRLCRKGCPGQACLPATEAPKAVTPLSLEWTLPERECSRACWPVVLFLPHLPQGLCTDPLGLTALALHPKSPPSFSVQCFDSSWAATSRKFSLIAPNSVPLPQAPASLSLSLPSFLRPPPPLPPLSGETENREP